MWSRSRTDMRRIEAYCDKCNSEVGIELIDSEITIKYCPVCGAELEDYELYNLDEAFMEEDWEE